MFNNAKIQTCFSEMVGMRASASSSDESLSTSLLTSTSGLYVNALPGVTWPILNGSKESWQGTLTDYLTNIFEDELQSLLLQFGNGLKTIQVNKELLTNQPLFSGIVDRNNVVTKGGNFIGFLIRPRESNSLETELKELALQISGAQTVRIFLYDTSKIDPITYYDFNYVSSGSEIWKQVTNFICDYQNLTESAGQTFLLGYYETAHGQSWELSQTAYYTEFCDCSYNRVKKVWQRWVSIVPVVIPPAALSWTGTTYNCPDTLNLESYITCQSGGLNAKVNVTCDITQVLCHNKYMFAEAWQKKIACRILSDYLATSRINAISDASKLVEKAQYYLDKYTRDLEGGYFGAGDKVVYNPGILKNLEIDFSNIDRVCLKSQPEITMGKKVRQGLTFETDEF